MKLILFLSLLLFCSFCPDGQSEPFSMNLALILSIAAACYEAISRFIPTRKGWSIIGKVLEVLTWLSNLLDRKK